MCNCIAKYKEILDLSEWKVKKSLTEKERKKLETFVKKNPREDISTYFLDPQVKKKVEQFQDVVVKKKKKNMASLKQLTFCCNTMNS